VKFLYLRDPLFLLCFALYFVNRWLLEPRFPSSLFTAHLNDLICIPFCVPIMLAILRVLRLRRDDAPPRSYEIVVPLILWSVAFELWLPTVPAFQGLATADYRDVFFYALGALTAGIVWTAFYRWRLLRARRSATRKDRS